MTTERDEITIGDIVVAINNYYSKKHAQQQFTEGKHYEVIYIKYSADRGRIIGVLKDDAGNQNSWGYENFVLLHEHEDEKRKQKEFFDWVNEPNTKSIKFSDISANTITADKITTGKIDLSSLFVNGTLVKDPDYLSENEKNILFDFATQSTDEYETHNGSKFSIFPCHDDGDSVHIEISPTQTWTKEDVWELVGELLYRVGNTDQEGNILDDETKLETTPKQILVLTTPGAMSTESYDRLKDHLRTTLKAAGIDAEPLILEEGMKANFLKLA